MFSDLTLTLFPAGGQNYVNLRGADSAPPPRDLGKYWTDLDVENAIRRAVTKSFKGVQKFGFCPKRGVWGQKPRKIGYFLKVTAIASLVDFDENWYLDSLYIVLHHIEAIGLKSQKSCRIQACKMGEFPRKSGEFWEIRGKISASNLLCKGRHDDKTSLDA